VNGLSPAWFDTLPHTPYYIDKVAAN